MQPFAYTSAPSRVIFGTGMRERLGEELDRLELKRVMVLGTRRSLAAVQDLLERLGNRVAAVYDRVAPHVPRPLVEEVCDIARVEAADGCVAVGGGSAIGLGKAVALRAGLPLTAIPTTYAGSEVTNIYGITDGGEKRTGRDARVLPRTVIYDPSLTLDLSPDTSAASGMNAIAHCVEALYAPDSNPVISLMAEEGIRALGESLPAVMDRPHDRESRELALYGAWLAGVSLGSAAMGLHHKLCHVLGGGFGLPHAHTHAIVLPHVARYNEQAAPQAMLRIARALGAEEASSAISALGVRLGLPRALRDIGMPEEGLARAAAMAVESPYANPRSLDFDGALGLLRNAW